MNKSRIKREGGTVILTVTTAFFVAMGLHVFVYRAAFAPSGFDGLAAMLQYLASRHLDTRINAGVFTLLLNLPLLLLALRSLSRRYVLLTLLYTAVFSLSLLFLSAVGFYQYDCAAGSGNSRLLAAVFGGCAQGLTGLLLRLGGSSGGVDVVGCLLQRKMPHRDLERVIAWVSYGVVAIALPVYGNLNSVLLSVISIYCCERVSSGFLRARRGGIRVEIVTEPARLPEVRRLVLSELGHGATQFLGRGMFTDGEKAVVVCLIGRRELPRLLSLLAPLPDTFLYYSDVLGIRGNFDYERKGSFRI